MRTLLSVASLGPVSGKQIRVLAVKLGVKHAMPLTELCRDGKISIVIDRRFPLDEVPEALRYLGEGHAKGKVLITPFPG
jgi:NADPH:quinone reductase-like Zn-dependent oxidoreductase